MKEHFGISKDDLLDSPRGVLCRQVAFDGRGEDVYSWSVRAAGGSWNPAYKANDGGWFPTVLMGKTSARLIPRLD